MAEGEVGKKLGLHLTADFCCCKNLPKISELQDFLADVREIILVSGASIVGELSHLYNEYEGEEAIAAFSCLWHIGESHVSMHSWPEEDCYLAADAFTCGESDPERIIKELQIILEPDPDLTVIRKISRGRNIKK